MLRLALAYLVLSAGSAFAAENATDNLWGGIPNCGGTC